MATIRLPVLMDYIYCAHRMRPDEVEQYLALFDQESFDPEHCARVLMNLGGVAWTLEGADGWPLAVGGFFEVKRGVWQAWMAGSMGAWDAHWRTLHKHAKRLMRTMLTSGQARRIQFSALASRERACAWYRRLGMVYEGTHIAYGYHGEDVVDYAITNRTGA